MKKSLLAGLIGVSAAAGALAQGDVVFEDSLSSGSIYVGSVSSDSSNYARAGTYTMALLWAAGSRTGVPQSAFTQIAIYGLATGEETANGYFFDPHQIDTGTATIPRTVAVFEVQGWLGNYTSYEAAVAGGAAVGQTAQFLNNTGDPVSNLYPPVLTSGWDGNLILVVPEPGTLVLTGLGAAGVWLFRRRK